MVERKSVGVFFVHLAIVAFGFGGFIAFSHAAPISTPAPSLAPSFGPVRASQPDATQKTAKLSVTRDTPKDQQPFWKKNSSVAKKVKDERAIVVSVRNEDVSSHPGLMRFTMLGAGHVAKPKDFCFRLGQQYHRLQQISDHFKTVAYDPARSQVFVVTEALGYQARMLLKLTPVSEDWRSEIQWEVIWGHFKGMTGVIGFERVDEAKTEVSVQAKYEAKELPVPKILLGFALEVITQKVAEKMRTYIEAQPASALDAPQAPPPPSFFFPTLISPVPPTKGSK